MVLYLVDIPGYLVGGEVKEKCVGWEVDLERESGGEGRLWGEELHSGCNKREE